MVGHREFEVIGEGLADLVYGGLVEIAFFVCDGQLGQGEGGVGSGDVGVDGLGCFQVGPDGFDVASDVRA